MIITSYMARLLSWLMRLATPAQPTLLSARASGRYSYVCSIANPSLLAGHSASFFFVLGPRHDSKPDGIHCRKEDEREHRPGEGAADQGVREGSPEHGVRQRDEGEDGRERGQDDGPRPLNRRFYDGVERSEALLQIVVDLSEEDERVAHQDARERDEADEGVDAERLLEHQQSGDHPDETERRCREHHRHRRHRANLEDDDEQRQREHDRDERQDGIARLPGFFGDAPLFDPVPRGESIDDRTQLLQNRG